MNTLELKARYDIIHPMTFTTILLLATTATSSPWDTLLKEEAPNWHKATGFSSEANAIFLDGEMYRGKKTRFFAYYSIPKSASETSKCPAVVLVHGGLGTAFDNWVKIWNERGYAAIAMDTCGSLPIKDEANPRKWKRHNMSGPTGWGGFSQIDEPIKDQWPYHAVSAVILSHNFLRSLPQIDKKKIGITGISWGGYLSCIASSVDHRFAWAAPVYGCGFYADGSAWAKTLSEMGERGEKWLRLWDAGVYLERAKCPFLFVSGTKDPFFTILMLKKSAEKIKGPVFYDIRKEMVHSQEAGACPESIRSFADHWSFGKALGEAISDKMPF
jgi:dienelactone hydrolase